METDAKGQLGGLECSDAVRRRMADASREWKCGSCGKPNEEILRECEEAVGRMEEGEKRGEEAVPVELKMGYRDEMGKGKEQESGEEKVESAELAEGFPQTTPPIVDEVPAVATSESAYPLARPAQTVPQPTATIQLPPQRQPAMVIRAQQSNDGVPIWIDRTIAGIVVLLIAMVLKLLLGL